MNFIDIHGHYAWDVDDGISTQEEALQALKTAKKNHIVGIVATPHIVPGTHTANDIQAIRNRIKELRHLAKQLGIGVFEGCELFLNHDCVRAVHSDLLIPFEKTKYVLAEFDVRKELGEEHEVEDYLYEIEMKGYKPIIAHVERYFKEEVDIERIQEFVNSGYVIQINATSLLGVHGKTVKKNAFQLIDEGLAHVIATDTHRAEGRRIPCLQEVYELLSKHYDDNVLQTLMFDNPYHILKNENVTEIKIKKSFLKKILKRR